MKKRIILFVATVLYAVVFAFTIAGCNDTNNNTETGDDIMQNPVITIEMEDGSLIKAEL